MYKFCVFAGTTEGRELIEFLVTQPVTVWACVATEYGETLLKPADNLHISAKRMTEEEMAEMMLEQHFDLVVDATHPYAPIVTENIMAACRKAETPYLRLLRGSKGAPADAVFVSDVEEAVQFLNGTEGNILLTTGSKELKKYLGLEHLQDRVYARVLPMDASLTACQEVGLKPSHILAMQGPFSEEMNVAMLRAVSAKYLVTKEGGAPGGFDEKVRAARTAGAELVVIGRPPQQEGLSYSETITYLCDTFQLTWKPCVSVVGIGLGNPDTMTGEVRHAIEQAECLIGAARMLEAVARPGQTVHPAIAPDDISAFIHTERTYRSFTVVMSGDVGFFSGTKKLLPLLSDCDVQVLPGLSSMVYLCAKLGTSYEDVVPVSIHGREHNLIPDVRAGKRIFTLVGGQDGMKNLCQSLVDAGLGHVKMGIGECLSYPDERVTVGTAEELAKGNYQTLAVALIENENATRIVTHGLRDEIFQRGSGEDGVVPMTKREVRAVSLSHLELPEDAVCWDIGAGTGSVALEMAMQARKGHVYAIERKEAALDLLRYNQKKLEVENLTVVPGLAPEACRELPAPTHVFIGGSGGNMREILNLLLEKNLNVRIVATAIALESVAELTTCMKAFPWKEADVLSLQAARGRKAGPYHLMTGQNPIYIFTMQAGGEEK